MELYAGLLAPPEAFPVTPLGAFPESARRRHLHLMIVAA